MPKAKISEFVDYLYEQVGNPYMWGGQGETVEALIRKLAKSKDQSDSNTATMLDFMKNHGFKDMTFFDCSGLGVCFLLEKKAITSDMTADMIYRKCDSIAPNEVVVGDFAFLLNSGGKATHIGYVVKDGNVIHALNQSKGVILEKMNARKWVYKRPSFALENDFRVAYDNLHPHDRITLYEPINGFNTAQNAINKVNPVVVYPPGTYYVYKIYGEATNITKKDGVAGAWVALK